MKKSLMLLAALALFATTPAFAAKGDKWIGIGGGASIPMSDLGDLVGTGWNGTAFFALGMAPKVDVGVDLGYHAWSGKDDVNGVDLSALDLTGIQGTAFAKYHLGSGTGKAMPYLKGGLGVYNMKEKLDNSDPALSIDESTSKFGFNVGGGVDWTVSPMYSIGLNAAYHQIMLDDEKFKNADGDTYNPSLVTVNLQLSWGMGKK